ncbi:hypothetical protein, partial [Stenotrophomonas sp. HMWF003]|uniref:hypothetical protein n=1 Tax=Stenotrophomonas sp. HMWF003 TaxID=2056840 RepID=UPI001C636B8B
MYMHVKGQVPEPGQEPEPKPELKPELKPKPKPKPEPKPKPKPGLAVAGGWREWVAGTRFQD